MTTESKEDRILFSSELAIYKACTGENTIPFPVLKKLREALQKELTTARREERERQWKLMMECLPSDAENLSLLTPDQAQRLIKCFIKNKKYSQL